MIGYHNDFRTRRLRLPPEAFLSGSDIPESPPQDLIEERIWNSIISFPDDVIVKPVSTRKLVLLLTHFQRQK